MTDLTKTIKLKNTDKARAVFQKTITSDEYFNENFVRQIDQRYRELNTFRGNLTKFNIIIILALLANLATEDFSVPIIQMTVQKIDQFKEYLLLFSSLIGIIIRSIQLYQERLIQVIDAWGEVKFKNKHLRGLAKLSFSAGGVKSFFNIVSMPNPDGIHMGKAASVYEVIWFTISILLILFASITIFIIHIILIIDIIKNPNLSWWAMSILLFIIILVDILTCISLITESIPLKYIDYRLLNHLNYLLINDPENHQKWHERLAKGEDMWPHVPGVDNKDNKKKS